MIIYPVLLNTICLSLPTSFHSGSNSQSVSNVWTWNFYELKNITIFKYILKERVFLFWYTLKLCELNLLRQTNWKWDFPQTLCQLLVSHHCKALRYLLEWWCSLSLLVFLSFRISCIRVHAVYYNTRALLSRAKSKMYNRE